MIKHVKKILPITKKYKVKLVINDDAHLAYKFSNIGFHLGQNDLKKNKKILLSNKKKLFGITCHNSINLAKKQFCLNHPMLLLEHFIQQKLKKLNSLLRKKFYKKQKN